MTATFHWHPDTRLIGAAPDLMALRQAVATGRGLHCGVAGVTTHAGKEVLCETSGSSGAPKVIRRSVPSWQASFAVNGAALDLGRSDGVAVFSGFGASLALYGLLEGAHYGMALLSLSHLAPQRWADALITARTTLLYVTPTQLALVCATGRVLPDVRHVMVGGGHLTATTTATARSVCPGARLTQFYGAAETSFISWTDDSTPHGSVGRPYPGVTLRLDADGLIRVRSPYLFDSYAQGTSVDTAWSDGFLTVGEMGWLDDAGNLFIMGRRSRMVTVADHNVFPDVAEAFLSGLIPGAAVAVVALPDATRGARLVAFVAGSMAGMTADDLRRACRDALGPHAAPHRIHKVAALPTLPAGKFDYTAIVALARSLT